MKVYSIAAAALLTACGVQPASSGDGAATAESSRIAPAADTKATAKVAAVEAPQMSFAVKAFAALPTCTTDNDGALTYIRDEKMFASCDAGAWNRIAADAAGIDMSDEAPGVNCPAGGTRIVSFVDADADGFRSKSEAATGAPKYVCNAVDGKDGSDGVAGKDGVAGANGIAGVKGDKGDTGNTGAAGANGNDNHIAEAYVCNGSVQHARFTAVGVVNLYSDYRVSVYTSGDVAAAAHIGWHETVGVAEGYGNPFSSLYGAGNANAATSLVTGPLNLITGSNGLNGGVWNWTLDRATSTATITYFDADMPAPTTLTWTNSCSKATY